MSSLGIISEELPQRCEFCGVIEETRPYGPEGEQICYDCGMKDPETTDRRMGIYLFGDSD